MSKKLLQVIAGTPDRPLIVNDIDIDCYVLEGGEQLELPLPMNKNLI